MTKLAEMLHTGLGMTTVDTADMDNYVRSPEGRADIQRGLADIQAGKIVTGQHSLADELKRRALARRG